MIIIVSVRKSKAGVYSTYLGGKKIGEPATETEALEWMANELVQPKRVVSPTSVFDIHDVMRHLGLTRNKAE